VTREGIGQTVSRATHASLRNKDHTRRLDTAVHGGSLDRSTAVVTQSKTDSSQRTVASRLTDQHACTDYSMHLSKGVKFHMKVAVNGEVWGQSPTSGLQGKRLVLGNFAPEAKTFCPSENANRPKALICPFVAIM